MRTLMKFCVPLQEYALFHLRGTQNGYANHLKTEHLYKQFVHIHRDALAGLTSGFLNHREIELPVFVPFMPVELPYLLHL